MRTVVDSPQPTTGDGHSLAVRQLIEERIGLGREWADMEPMRSPALSATLGSQAAGTLVIVVGKPIRSPRIRCFTTCSLCPDGITDQDQRFTVLGLHLKDLIGIATRLTMVAARARHLTCLEQVLHLVAASSAQVHCLLHVPKRSVHVVLLGQEQAQAVGTFAARVGTMHILGK